MKNFQNNRRGGRFLSSWPVLIILLVLVFSFAFGVFGFMNKMKETIKNKVIAKEKVIELEKRKEKLLLDIENLNTDEGMERVFRENFGLAKRGESLIVIVQDENIIEDIKEKKFLNFFSFFKNWFKW